MKNLLILTFLACSSLSVAQDYHHWSEQFGARASLLGGAATAGLGDNATVYYNTAAMAFVEHPSLSISVNAYRYRTLKYENAFGPGLDYKATHFSSMPNLIAGVLPLIKHPKLRLGYAVITRRSFNNKFDLLDESDLEIFPGLDGPERYILGVNVHHQLMEYWAGFGLSYQVSKEFSVGISHYGIYRDVKYSSSVGETVLPSDTSAHDVYTYSASESFNYYNVKGVFKASIALNVENFRLGVSYTTPSFNMFGKAKAYRELEYINLAAFDVLLVDRIEGIKVKHKEYGSLAIGVSWRLGKKAWLHVTNETYFGGKEYYIFDADEKPSIFPDIYTEEQLETLGLGGQNFISLTEESQAVTNLGMGLEAQMAKRWTLYLGARTDWLYNETPGPDAKEGVMRIASSQWHLYHFSLGLGFLTKKNKKYTAGLEYGVGSMTFAKDLGNSGSHSFKLLLEIEVGKPPKNQ